MITVRLSSLEVIVQGQFIGICLHSSSGISSTSSAKLPTFWGIRCLQKKQLNHYNRTILVQLGTGYIGIFSKLFPVPVV